MRTLRSRVISATTAITSTAIKTALNGYPFADCGELIAVRQTSAVAPEISTTWTVSPAGTVWVVS